MQDDSRFCDLQHVPPVIRDLVQGLCMFENQTHDPKVFVEALRQFHESDVSKRGELANTLSDAIVSKRVDLAEVRQVLLDTGEHELMDTLDRLLELIEPYIQEGGVDE